MAAAWMDAMRGVDAEMELLATQMANDAAAGRPVRLWHVHRQQRYRSIMRQIGGQMREYAPVAVDEMTQAQTLMARMGIEHAEQLVAMQLPGIGGQFDRLPISAVQNMVGNAGDGSPLGQLLRTSWGQQAPDVAGVLVKGVALGWHPVKIAKAMRDAVDVGLERALLISRTEVMRVYRESSRQSYIKSGVVDEYMRVAAKSGRTCMACIMEDGARYPVTVPFSEHPAGRCQAVPVVRGAPPLEFERGPEWFDRQDAATQKAMLGPGKYSAWQAGKFDLPDLVKVVPNRTWGDSLQVRSLGELTSGPGPRVARTVAPAGRDYAALRQNLVSQLDTDALEMDKIDAGIASLKAQYKDAGNRYEKGVGMSKEEMTQLRDLVNYELPAKLKEYEKQREIISVKMRQVVVRELELPKDKRANVILHLDNIKSKASKEAYRRTTEEASDFVNRITAVSQFPDDKFNLAVIPNKTGRASGGGGVINMSSKDSVRTVVHEIGHNIESKRGAVGRAARVAFYDARTSGDRIQRLSSLLPDHRYGSGEVTKKDKWAHPYTGSVYTDTDRQPASEIISMGLETLYAEPHKLIRDDPGFFDFLIRYLQGD